MAGRKVCRISLTASIRNTHTCLENSHTLRHVTLLFLVLHTSVQCLSNSMTWNLQITACSGPETTRTWRKLTWRGPPAPYSGGPVLRADPRLPASVLGPEASSTVPHTHLLFLPPLFSSSSPLSRITLSNCHGLSHLEEHGGWGCTGYVSDTNT